MLKKYVNEENTDWDDYIEAALFAYNTSIQSSSKYSPYTAMFGREVLLPLELEYGSIKTILKPNDDEAIEKLIEDNRRMDIKLNENISKAQEKQKRQYDNKHTLKSFQLGDIVFKTIAKKPLVGGKFRSGRSSSDYRIIEELPSNKYKLQDVNDLEKKEVCSGIFLEHVKNVYIIA